MSGLFYNAATGNAPQQQPLEPQAPISFREAAIEGGTPQEPERDSEGFFGTVLDKLGFSAPKNNFMAIGQTPKGEAYYGEGLGGWARRTFAKFMDPAKRDEGLSDIEKQHAADWAKSVTDEWAARNPNLASYKDYYSAWAQASALDKTRVAKGGGASVALGEAGNVLKTGLVDVGIMGVLQLGDIGMRKVLSAGEGVDDIANTSSNLPSWSPFEQQKQWIRDNIPGGDGMMNVADNFDPVGNSWNLIRYSQSQFEKGDVGQGLLSAALSPVALLSGPLGQGIVKGIVGGTEYLGNDAQEKAIIARNQTASNMLYTQMWDPLVKTEIMRRLESGEPATFVEESLANPWAELGGSLVLDPLNLIGAGEAKSAKLLDKVNDVSQVAPEVKSAMEALGKLDDVADPQIVKKGLQALTDSVTAAFKSDQLKQTYGAMSLTANGNRFVLGRELGGWLKNLVGMHLDDTDQAAAMVQKVADLSVAVAQGDEAAKLDALTWLSRAPGGEQVFTARGRATMAVFERMLQKTDDAGKVIGHDSPAQLMTRLLDAAKEGKTAAEQTEILATKAGEVMDKALEKIFPTVSDIKKLDPKAYDALPGYVKAANDLFSRDSKLGAAYAKANGFFSSIYMGLSPAFVFRNGLTNTISVMADQGLKAGAEAQLGQIESFFRPGAIHQRAVDDLTKIFGSLPIDLMSKEGLAKEVNSGFGVLGRNARVEQTGRALLMRNAAVAELERAYRTGLPGIEALTKGGFSEAQIGYLMDAIRSERGVQAGVKKFVDYLGKTGGVVEPQKLVQLPAKTRGFLRQLGLETVVDGLRQGDYATADEFRAAAQKVLDDITQFGNKAKNELSTVSPDSPGVDVVKNVAQGLKGEQGQALTDVFGHMVNTFDNARYAAADAIKKFLGAQEQAGVPVSDAYNAVLDTLNGPEGKITKTALMDHLQMIRDMVPKAKRGELPVADLLNKLKFNINGEVFDITKLADTAGITADNVGDVVWSQYWPSVSAEAWGRLNHNQYAALENIVTNMGGDPAILGPARDLMAEGFRFQDLVVKSKSDPAAINRALEDIEKAAEAAANAPTGAVSDVLSKASAAGWKRGAKGLLSAVNKDLGTTYAKLDEVPVAELEKALTSRGVNVATQWPGKATKLAENTAAASEKIITTPRGQLPEQVSSAMLDEARKMLDEVLSGEAGKRTAEAVTKSTYPDWYGEIAKKSGGREAVVDALNKIIKDKGTDKGKTVERLKEVGLESIWSGDKKLGVPPNISVMELMGASQKQLNDALDTFNDIARGTYGRDLSMDEVKALDELSNIERTAQNATGADLSALNERMRTLFDQIPADLDAAFERAVNITNDIATKMQNAGATVDEIAQEAAQVTPAARPYVRSATQHGLTGAVMEQLPGFTDEFTKWVDNVSAQFGKVSSGKPTSQLDMAAFEKWAKEATSRDAIIKQTALETARHQADFALHAYGDKTYLDAAMAFIYPYHYWYGRTYKNWMERLIQKPGIIAGYGKYRKAMETMHAGMPDWWKYNLSTNDLPGIDMENPLYFNLEATLNPLNGLTGTDFDDSKKRVDWLSRTVDDLGKFGPSMFTPLSWMMAAKLYADGQEEAGSRWLGRLLPQSSTVKAALSLTGQNYNFGPLLKNNEIDPFVNLFSGGLDPYERGRVGRALAAMVQDGSISAEQSIDAGNAQSGPVWEQAVLRATQLRAPGQLASFFAGVGFKGRTKEDIQVDNFYTEYYQVMGAAPNMPPDTFREAMAMLEQKYPFMSTVLISRRADDDRNSAYAYNVLSRIPPGQSSDMLKKAGISTDMIGRFYDTKGTFKGWTPQDISRFMAGIGDMGALFAIPDYATKSEWNDARNAYGGMTTAMKQQFGPDILDKIDVYYSLPKDKQSIYIGQHPEITAAFNFKSQSYSTDPVLYKYYGGIEAVEKFYKSQMYAELEKKYGKDISAKWDEYYNLQLSSTSQAKAYYRAHPELASYSKEKAKWNEYVLKASARVAAMMPDTTPGIQMRPDAQPSGEMQQNLANAMQPKQEPSWNEWQGVLSEPLQRLVLDYWLNDKKLSSSADSQLNYMAPKYGYKNGDDLLQALGASIYRAQAQYSQP